MISLIINYLRFVCLLSLLIVFGKISAQEDCSFTLSKAQKMYDAGQIEQIPQMLQPCIENGFTSEDKLQAQKLIVLAYLFDNNTKEADKTMLAFLKKYPEYEILPADQAEFVQLFKTYRTVPIASIGILGGVNFSSPFLLQSFGTDGTIGDYYGQSAGFQGGLSFRRYIIDKLDINVEALFAQNTYNYLNENAPGGNILDFNETQQNIELPITAIYSPFSFKKYTPFARLGFNVSYLLKSSGNELLTNIKNSKERTGVDFILTDSRYRYNFKITTGLGTCYNLKRSYLMLDIRYNLGFMNQVSNRFKNQEVNWYYQNVDNNFSLSNLNISVGFFYKFYKPQKKTL